MMREPRPRSVQPVSVAGDVVVVVGVVVTTTDCRQTEVSATSKCGKPSFHNHLAGV